MDDASKHRPEQDASTHRPEQEEAKNYIVVYRTLAKNYQGNKKAIVHLLQEIKSQDISVLEEIIKIAGEIAPIPLS